MAYSRICKIPVNPSSLNCFVNERGRKKNLLSVQLQLATQRRTQKDSAFVNTNINIPPDRCGAVIVNWGPADWFSFSTRAVERQFNFLSCLAFWETIFFIFYFIFLLSSPKNVNTTLSALSTFSAVTDITWPQFMKRHGRDTYRQHNMNILSSPMCPVFSASESYWRMCWKCERPSLK